VSVTHRSVRVDVDVSAGGVDLACLEAAAVDFARRGPGELVAAGVDAMTAELFDTVIGAKEFPLDGHAQPTAPWGCTRCGSRRGFRRRGQRPGGRSVLTRHPQPGTRADRPGDPRGAGAAPRRHRGARRGPNDPQERCGVALGGRTGRTTPGGWPGRVRPNHAGDRQANHALWRIVLTRMSSHPDTRVYERGEVQGGDHALSEALRRARNVPPPPLRRRRTNPSRGRPDPRIGCRNLLG